ncbi:uncharacterized protein MELLADRAFT_95948 [Melampsora larici-populina 98AG31]|uniref:Secreted protein n=1 Tax=Melampsora larici-populina (strain 98AG31 / pathotype 3-4-7) TaxID=747676 RepID=F4RDV1_MELLP|nr:uncharacterized protein MELLADRAFT_95948 [Melampsora larici-populina 98AG31]EGG09545.1 hypothetical protein MELLADRAFT_95948 [Melampsora larici-populina 98AG31]
MLFSKQIIFALPFIQVALTASNSSRNSTVCKPKSSQNSTTLHRSARQSASAQDGSPTGNMTGSLTSSNNFINFCVSKEALGAKLMNGSQSAHNYSCNGIPMGMIPAPDQFPSCKFVHPINFSNLKANTTFNIILKIKNMVTGKFTNPTNTYFSAPQQISPKSKQVIGHAHVVIQKISTLNSTKTVNPTKFSFFKGIDTSVGKDNTSFVEVTNGLPVGSYRLSSMLSAANHQPILSGVAQRGTFDDVVYFTVS